MQKRFFVVALCLSVAGCAHPQADEMKSNAATVTRSDASYRTLNASPSVRIYRAHRGGALDQASVGMKAARFGITGSAKHVDSEWVVEGAQTRFSVSDLSGEERFEDFSDEPKIKAPLLAGQTQAGPKPALPVVPGHTDAERIANKYLKEHNLNRDKDYVYYNSVTFSGAEVGQDQATVVSRELVYKLRLDGKVVHGATGTIKIRVAGNGKVDRVVVDWPEFDAEEVVAVKEAEHGLAGLSARVDAINKHQDKYRKITKHKTKVARLDYFAARSADGSVTELVPTYVSIGDSVLSSGVTVEQFIFVSASDAKKLPD